MDKKTFKSNFITLLKSEVVGLAAEEKVKYIKKWIRDYEIGLKPKSTEIDKRETVKIGVLVRITLRKLVKDQLLSEEKVRLLQDERYCKSTFDINYPFLKKVQWATSKDKRLRPLLGR
jgi:hypothetical protein